MAKRRRANSSASSGSCSSSSSTGGGGIGSASPSPSDSADDGAATSRSSSRERKSRKTQKERRSRRADATATATGGQQDGGASAPNAQTSAEPAEKRRRLVVFEPIRLPSISGVRDIDDEVIRAVNRKLAEQTVFLRRQLADERKKVERMSRKQQQDDHMLMTINRYWNNLDEEVQQLIGRLGEQMPALELKTEAEDEEEAATSADAAGDQPSSSTIQPSSRGNVAAPPSSSSSFVVAQLYELADQDELDDRLAKRVAFSTKLLSVVLSAIDARTAGLQRVHRTLLKSGKSTIKKEEMEDCTGDGNDENNMNALLRLLSADVVAENARLADLSNRLQTENRSLRLRCARAHELDEDRETRDDEWRAQVEEERWKLEKSARRVVKLEQRLVQLHKQNQTMVPATASSGTMDGGSGAPQMNGTTASGDGGKLHGDADNGDRKRAEDKLKTKVDELRVAHDAQAELAERRLTELQDSLETVKTLSAQLEEAQHKVTCLPVEAVEASREYHQLRDAFTASVEECERLRMVLAKTEERVAGYAELERQRQLDVEKEHELSQQSLEKTVHELESQLNKVRCDYNQLRMECEQELQSSNSTAAADLKAVIESQRGQIAQHKADAQKFKKKWHDAVAALHRAQKDLEAERKRVERAILVELDATAAAAAAAATTASTSQQPENGGTSSIGDGATASPANGGRSGSQTTTAATADEKRHREQVLAAAEKLINASDGGDEEERRKTLQQLLEFARQTGQPTANEHRLRAEIRALTEKVRLYAIDAPAGSASTTGAEGRKRFYDEEAARRLRALEQTNEKLKRDLQNMRLLEEEVETTGSAYEQLERQNEKLRDQLTTHADSELKAMTERMVSNQLQAKLRAEVATLEEQLKTADNEIQLKTIQLKEQADEKNALVQLKFQLDRQLLNVRQMAERQRGQLFELTAARDALDLRCEKSRTQLEEAQQTIASRVTAGQQYEFQLRRLEEDKMLLRRKLERAKKAELAGTLDAVLLEENRQLKEQQTCPTCKVRDKDAVLTKCMHVFCMDCIKQRYDNRRRKCPKCNAPFGANDFKRIYF